MSDGWKSFLVVMAMLAAGGALIWNASKEQKHNRSLDFQEGRAQMRDEAIAAGVAHWTIDPKTGERRFEFVGCGEG